MPSQAPVGRKIRVCLYGGTDLGKEPAGFVATLSRVILEQMPAIIVTGGFKYSQERPKAISTDMAALQGAAAFVAKSGRPLSDYFEAWVPEPRLDGRREHEGVIRMGESDDVTLRLMAGRTALGRRLAMVAGVDVVVTISGHIHTEVVAEQALELGIPLVPIPDAGGDSEQLLRNYRQRIGAAFGQGALDTALAVVAREIGSAPEKAARAVVELIRTAKIGRCLVLLPYDKEHDLLYKTRLGPRVARHMVPVRLDQLPRSGDIYTSFAEGMRSSSAVIADITKVNENVMYEIGYAHGRGLTPLLYTRDPGRREQLPVYFKTLNVRVADEGSPLEELIDDYLRSFKQAHGLTEPSLAYNQSTMPA